MPPKDKKFSQEKEVDDEDHITQEWQEYMSDFLPSELITVSIDASDHFEMFFDNDKKWTKFRGAFFSSGSKETSSIDVFVVGPR